MNVGCWISYGGKKYFVNDYYEILINDNNANLKWIKHNEDKEIPSNAIKGGRAENGDVVYIGRCKLYNNNDELTLVIGKVHLQGNKAASVPFNKIERLCTSFELLVCNEKENHKTEITWFKYGEKHFPRCDPDAPRKNGKIARCNPNDPNASCCDKYGVCGVGPEFCDCKGCVDYRNR